MRKTVINFSLSALLCVLCWTFGARTAQAQCPPNGFFFFNYGTVACGTFTSHNVTTLSWDQMNVVNGGLYEVSTCSSTPGLDTEITILQNGTNAFVAFDDDNGPLCSGLRASIAFTSTFTGIANVYINPWSSLYTSNCGYGIAVSGTPQVPGIASAVLEIRQVDNITITASTANICLSQTKSLTATPATGTWSVQSGSGSIAGTTYTPSGTGSVTLRYTLGACFKDFTFGVTPTLVKNNITVPGATDFCNSFDPPAMSSNLSGTTGTETVNWYYVDGTACPSAGGAIFAGTGLSFDPPAGLTVTRTFQYEVTGAACNNGFSPNCITFTNVTPTVTASGSPTTICAGQTSTITATSPTGTEYRFLDGVTLLQDWSPDPDVVYTGVNATASPVIKTINVATRTSPTCESAVFAVPITVNPVPAAPTLSGNNFCVSANENYSIVTPDPAATYDWTITGGTPATATGTSVAVNWTGIGSVSFGSLSVTATKLGCASTPTVQNIGLTPIVTLTPDKPETCGPTTVTWTASGPAGAEYEFTAPGFTAQTYSTIATYTQGLTATTTATVTCRTTDGLGNFCFSTPVTATANIYPIPSITSISSTPPIAPICANATNSFVLTANATVQSPNAPVFVFYDTDPILGVIQTVPGVATGATTFTASTSGIALANGQVVSVIVQNPSGGITCESSASNFAPLTINPIPQNTQTLTAAQICSGQTGNVVVNPSEVGVNYQALVGGSSVGAVVAGTGASISVTVPPANYSVGSNTIGVRATNATTGCTVDLVNTANLDVLASPTLSLTVNGDIVCENASGTVTIVNSEIGVDYQLKDALNANVGTAVSGTGANIVLTVPAASLVVGSNVFTVQATLTSTSCVAPITQTATITVNPNPNTGLTVNGSTVCFGVDGTITIPASQASVIYQAMQGGAPIGSAVAGTGASITLTIPAPNLVVGLNTFDIQAGVGATGCTAMLVNQGNINVLAVPTLTLTATGNTVCQNQNGTVTVSGTQLNVNYEIFQGGLSVAGPLAGTGGNLVFTIPAANLIVGANPFDVKATFTANSCGANLNSPAVITVNALPNVAFSASGNTVCLGVNGTITIAVSDPAVSYQAMSGVIPVGSAALGTGASLDLTIPSASLIVGSNNFTIQATTVATACVATTAVPVTVTVSPAANLTLTVLGSTVCIGQNGTITIVSSQAGVVYQVTQGGANVGSPVNGTGADINLTVPAANLVLGTNSFGVSATLSASSCTTPLNSLVDIIVNNVPSLTLTLAGNTVCFGQAGTITISNSEVGVDYQASQGGTLIGAVVAGTGGTINVTVPAGNLVAGVNTFQVSATSTTSSCSANLTANVDINVNPLPLTNLVLTGNTVCAGQNGTITVNSSQNGVSYQVLDAALAPIGAAVVGNGANIDLTVPSANLVIGANSFTVQATVVATGCVANNATQGTVTVNALPTLTLTLSGSTICIGSTGTVTVQASQAGATYQLLQGGAPIGSPVAGTGANINLVVPVANLVVGTNTFSVSVSAGATGCSATMSSTADVIVNNTPALTLTLSGNTVCFNQAGTITITNSEVGVSYQTSQGGTLIGAAVAGTGANITVTVPAANLVVGVNTLQVSATNTVSGCSANLSANVDINVNALPLTNLVLTGNTVCAGQNGTITVNSSQNGVSYQVLDAALAPIGAAVVGNGANIDLTVPSANLVIGANPFTVQATVVATGCVANNATQGTVTVNALPTLTLTLSGSTICIGSTGTVTVQASQAGATYQLLQGGAPIGSPVAGTGANINLVVPVANLVVGTNTFSVSVSAGATGCSATMTSTADVIVNNTPSLVLTLSGNTVCFNQAGTITITNSEVGVSYQTSQGGTLIGAAVAGTGANITVTVPAANLVVGVNTLQVSATNTVSGCSANLSANVDINVNPLPVTNLVLSGNTVCVGQNGTITVNASQGGVSYQVLDASLAPIGAAVVGNNANIDLTVPLANLVVGANSFTVQATVVATGCVANNATQGTVTVNALPNLSLVLSGSTVCIGSTGTITVNASEIGATYQLLQGGLPIGAPVAGTGANINLIVPAANLVVGTNTFGVTVSAGGTGCSASLTATSDVIVNNVPTLTLTLSGNTVCFGQNGTITITASESGVSYQAFQGATPIGAAANGTGFNLDLTIPSANLVVGANNFSVTATNTVSACASPLTSAVVVNVNPLPVTTVTANGNTVCLGQNGDVTIVGSQNGFTYQLLDGGGANVGLPVAGNGGNIVLNVPSAILVVGANNFTVQTTNNTTTCVSTASTQATVTVNPLPTLTLTVNGSTVCLGQDGTLTIVASQAGAVYQLLQGGVPIGAPVSGTGANIDLIVPSANLVLGVNTFSVSASVGATGCSSQLNASADVIVNNVPSIAFTLTGSTVCFGDPADITVSNTQNGVSYQAQSGGANVGAAVVGNGATITLTIPAGNLVVGTNNFDVLGTAVASACPATATLPVSINVNPLPSINLVVNGSTVCAGDDATVTIINSENGVTYQLSQAGPVNIGGPVVGNGGLITLNIPAGNLVPGANNFTITATNNTTGCPVNAAAPAVVTVNPAPTLSLNLVGSTVCIGSDGTLTIQASQNGVSYQAFQGVSALSPVVNGTGADITLTIPAANLVLGTNTFTIEATQTVTGCSANMNSTVDITVIAVPVVTINANGGTPVCFGDNGVVNIIGSQNGVTYQVETLTGTLIGAAVPGTGGDIVVSVPAANLVVGANDFNIVAVNTSTGCTATLNQQVTVDVLPLPSLTLLVNGSTVCIGQSATVTIIGSENGVSYQLTDAANVAVGAPVAGTGANIVLTIPANSLIVGANNFNVAATITVTGCDANLTAPATITVNPVPDITLTVPPTTACDNTDGAVVIPTSQNGVAYQLFQGATAIGGPVNGTGGSISIPVSDANLVLGTNTFSIQATFIATSCQSTLIDNGVITVTAVPTTTFVLTGSVVCDREDATLNVDPTVLGLNYQVLKAGVPIGAVVVGTGAAITIPVLDADINVGLNTFTVEVTIASSGCSSTSSASTDIQVNPVPLDNLQPIAVTVCVGNDANIVINNTQLGVNYEILNAFNTVIVGPTAGNGSSVQMVIPAAELVPGANSFPVRATFANTGCTVDFINPANVTVNGLPSSAISVTDATVCEGQTATISVTGPVVGVTYSLADSNGVAINVTGVVNGANIDFTIPVANLLVGDNDITVIAVDNSTGCPVNLTDVSVVRVNPLPVLSLSLVGATVCESIDAQITIQNSQAGIDYQASVGATLVGSAVAGTGGDILVDVPAANLAVGNNTVSVQATVQGTSCVSNLTQTTVVTVIAAPVFNPTSVIGDTIACVGKDAVITVRLSQLGFTYEVSLGGTQIAGPVTGTGGNLPITIPSAALVQNAVNPVIVTITSLGTGCTSVQSASKTVNIDVVPNPNPAVSVTVASNTSCEGSTVDVTIGGAAGITFQLFKGTTAVGAPATSNGTPVVITIPASDLAVGPNTFTVVSTSTVTNCSATLSTSVTINVFPQPAVNAAVNASGANTVCFGQNAIITVNPAVVGINYTPMIGGLAAGPVTPGNGGLLFLVVDAANLVSGANLVTVEAENQSTNCISQLTATVTLNVVPPPAFTNVVTGQNVCVGNDASVTVEVSNLGIRYLVYSPLQPNAPIAQGDGTNGDLQIIIPKAFLPNATNTVEVYAVDIASNCTTTVSIAVTITIFPLPATTIGVLDGGTICLGGTSFITLSVDPNVPQSSNPAEGDTYQLLDSLGNPVGAAVTIPVGGSAPTQFPVGVINLALGVNEFFVQVTSPNGCVDTLRNLDGSINFGEIVVVGTPTLDPIAPVSACQFDQSFEVEILNPVGNVVYQMFLDAAATQPIGTPVTAPLAVPSILLTADLSELPQPIVPGVVKLTVKAVSAPGTSAPCLFIGVDAVTLNIIAAPVMTQVPTTQPVCIGSVGDILIPLTDFPGFQYLVVDKATGTLIVPAVDGTGGNVHIEIPAAALSVPGTDVQIFVVNNATGCLSAPFDLTIPVNNLPNNIFAASVSPATVCEGVDAEVVLASSQANPPTSYQLFNLTTNLPIGSAVAGTGDPLTMPLSAAGLNVGNNVVIVIASNNASACTSTLLDTLEIFVNPVPNINMAIQGNVVCQGTGQDGTLTVTGTDPAVTYQIIDSTGTAITGLQIGGTDLVFTIPFNKLLPGINTFRLFGQNVQTGCFSTTVSVGTIKMNVEAAAPVLAVTAPICEGQPAVITVTDMLADDYKLYYDETGGNPISSSAVGVLVSNPLLADTTLWVEAVNQACTGSPRTSIRISVVKLPQSDFTLVTDTSKFHLVVPNAVVTFENQSTDFVSVKWFFGDDSTSTELNPTHEYADSGRYFVTLVTYNELGCTDTLVLGPYIVLDDVFVIAMPNAFSPNGDLLNDQFVFDPIGFDEYCITFYDRWGREVYKNNCECYNFWKGLDKGGNPVPEGAYIYKLTAKRYSNGLVKEMSGSVTVIR